MCTHKTWCTDGQANGWQKSERAKTVEQLKEFYSPSIFFT